MRSLIIIGIIATDMHNKYYTRLLLNFTGLFFLALALWTAKFFGRVTIDQAISTINLDFSGVIAADSIFIKRFVEWCVFWPLVIALPLSFVRRKLYWILLTIGLIYAGYQYNIYSFLKQLTHFTQKDDYFQTNYVDPRHVAFKSKHPKNLVFIYVESLETTYSDQSLFGHDLLKKLQDIKPNHLSFNHQLQMPGASWTIAGIIASQCGIPLKSTTIFNGNRIGENINHYLSGATCLSDILAAHGYRNVFMNGPALKFAGVNKFLKSHHYTEMYGVDEWRKMNLATSDIHGWGLADDALFRQAKIKLGALIKAGKPFNLTILTVNTHGPEGHLNATCRAKGYHHFEGIVECTAGLVADFVNYADRQGWLENTNIMIMGDHLAMDNTVFDKLKSANNRYIFNMLVSKQALHKNTDSIVTFDMLPTVLESLGFHYKSGKLGLGYSAIAEHRERQADNRINEMSSRIDDYSKRYQQFWLAN